MAIPSDPLAGKVDAHALVLWNFSVWRWRQKVAERSLKAGGANAASEPTNQRAEEARSVAEPAEKVSNAEAPAILESARAQPRPTFLLYVPARISGRCFTCW